MRVLRFTRRTAEQDLIGLLFCIISYIDFLYHVMKFISEMKPKLGFIF